MEIDSTYWFEMMMMYRTEVLWRFETDLESRWGITQVNEQNHILFIEFPEAAVFEMIEKGLLYLDTDYLNKDNGPIKKVVRMTQRGKELMTALKIAEELDPSEEE